MNPIDSTIRAEFMKWNKARVGGKLVELKGLTRRRDAEANLYFYE
jgi:GH24 family phage-related lysozyme (muramidase)